MIDAPCELPCGVVLPNRLAKAALSEQLGDPRHAPSEQLIRLYQRWSRSGAGLLITGNVMVDPAAIGEPANVVVEGRRDLDQLRRWARAAKAGGATVIAQVNHPGRQVPRALSVEEIHGIQDRFARTARVLIAAGFDGVQLHGAHGCLISQFLSPIANQRTDEYGGDPAKRRRFLLELVEKTREAIGPDRILSVKLNIADVQRGGFDEDESIEVSRRLAAVGIDLLELSGGTSLAEKLRAQVDVPLMVTGDFRTRRSMDAALASGAVDVIGLGRPMAVQPDALRLLLNGSIGSLDAITEKRLGHHKLDGMAETGWYTTQLWRMGRGKDPAVRRPAAVGVGHYLLGGLGHTVRKKVS